MEGFGIRGEGKVQGGGEDGALETFGFFGIFRKGSKKESRRCGNTGMINAHVMILFFLPPLNMQKSYTPNRLNIQFELKMSSKSSVFNNNSELTINHFTVKQQIGSGKFGIVYRAVARYSERDVAIRIVSKKTVEESTLYKQLQREIEIHSKLKHPFICELYAYFHDARNIYLVLEYCPHGSLYAPIKKAKEVFSDKKIASIFLQLVQAVAYLHQRNVMHRDMKLENVLLDEFFNAKISDFGWCVHQTNERKTFCGTMEYICPEMVSKENYSHSVDIYCLGIILYELFYFKSPFIGETEDETFRNIKEAEVRFDDNIRKVPDSAKELISLLLRKNMADRPKAKDLIRHEFITKFLNDDEGDKSKKERITEKEFRRWRESLTVEYSPLSGIEKAETPETAQVEPISEQMAPVFE